MIFLLVTTPKDNLKYLSEIRFIMSEKRHIVTITLNEFTRQFMPKLEKLGRIEKIVCARLMKAALEKFIEEND
jgi:hypothetical protein